ncbi:DNA polymerase III subunit beta [Gammaproteobacteria bacterium]
MRLTNQQKTAILAACRRHFGDAECWLFGSRVNDAKRGGDIDLYIETAETDADKLLTEKLAFLVALDHELGEQKIDVVIRRLASEALPIHNIAKKTGVRL